MPRRLRALVLAAAMTALAGPAMPACTAVVDFDFGSSALTVTTRAVLDRVAAHARGASLKIIAHADAPAASSRTSSSRASAPRRSGRHLAARGVGGGASLSARGQSELLVIDHGPNRANRRAVIAISPCTARVFPPAP